MGAVQGTGQVETRQGPEDGEQLPIYERIKRRIEGKKRLDA